MQQKHQRRGRLAFHRTPDAAVAFYSPNDFEQQRSGQKNSGMFSPVADIAVERAALARAIFVLADIAVERVALARATFVLTDIVVVAARCCCSCCNFSTCAHLARESMVFAAAGMVGVVAEAEATPTVLTTLPSPTAFERCCCCCRRRDRCRCLRLAFLRVFRLCVGHDVVCANGFCLIGRVAVVLAGHDSAESAGYDAVADVVVAAAATAVATDADSD